jgi:type I restriction enzyme, S subunit
MSEWQFVDFQSLSHSDAGSFSIGPFGSAITTDNYVSDGVPVVRGVNLARGIFVDGEFVYITDAKADELTRSNLVAGDLVFTHRGTIGQVSMIPRKPRFRRYVLSSSQVKARLDPTRAFPEFYYYWFRSPEGRQGLLANTSVVGVPGIGQPLATIRKLAVPCPPLAVQRAIVNVLAALDDKIAVNDRITSAVLALGDTCFIEMTRTSTTRRSTLAELAAEKMIIFGDGYRTKRSEHGQPGLPILRVAEVMNGRIKPEFVDFVADSYRSAMGGKVSQAGDVILTTKGTVGRVAAITAKDPAFVYSPQLCYFRVLANPPLSSSYIYFWLRSSDFWQQAETRKSQTDMADYLSLTDIRKLTIPMSAPGPSQQSSPTLSGLLAQISACHEENKALVELRDALLPMLMSGQIRVRDAEKVVEDVT